MRKLFIVLFVAVGVWVFMSVRAGEGHREAQRAHFENIKSNAVDTGATLNADGSYTLSDGSRAVLDAEGKYCPCRPGACKCPNE
jgi:hypothetical protein